MKNIVNRALVAKKKQFQSKSVPRGARTIWRYLGALFLLFTFAVGNVWAADPDVDFTMSTSTKGDYFKNYTVGTNTVTISTSASSISSGNGGYYIDLGSNSSVFSTNYLGVKVTGGATISKVEILASGSGNNKSITAPVVGWKEGWDGSGTTADAGLTLSYTTPGSNGSKFSTAEWREANVASWGATEVRIYKKLSSVTVTDYTLPTTAETVRVWGVRVYLSTGGTTTTYTVTLNPGDGAYASAPTGWTADGSNIKKTVSAGALTIPEPTRAGYKVTGWKSGLVDVALSAGKLTVSKDTSLTAQWAEAECKIYSLTGEIGSAAGTAGDYEVTASALILKNSNARIKLTPAGGETFKTGDVITISGFTGNAAKKLGVYVKNAAGSSNIATAEETNLGDGFASATLSADAEYVFLARKESTTMNVLTCEIHRACAEGVAAGLAYATTEVAKTEGDAAFTNPLTNANGLVIAGYKSSNTAVATVATNGQVTVVGPGSATITANSAVQTKAGTLYAVGTASYTLTVAACTPPRTPEFATTDPVVVTKNSATATWDVNGADASVAKYQVSVVKKSDASVVLDWTDCVYANPCTYEATGLDPETEYTFKLRSVGATGYCALSDVVTEDFTTLADLADKYTVIFKDGDVTLDTKQFDVASNPSDADIDKTKSLFTFAAWQKDAVDIALDDAFWASVLKDAEIILTARWTKVYAMSIDMEQFVLDNSKAGNWHAYLDSKGYVYASSDMSLDSLDGGKTKNNYQYLGLKFNKNSENTYVEGNLAAGKLMVVKVGAIGNNTYMKIDGAKVTEPAIVGGVEADSAAAYTYWYYDTDKTFSLFHENGGTSMLKAITITDPFEVSFDADGGDPVAAQYGEPYVTLPLPVKGTESFLGWFDGETNVGMNGDKYTPTANITLVAHWEAVSTDARLSAITFSSNAGTLAPAFDPEVTSYTYTMPYGTAAIPTITGATSVNAKAQDPIIGDAAAAWGEAQTVKGVAQSGDKKTYTITMAKAPKDGVSIIKATINSTTKNTIGEVTGLYKKDASCGGLSGYKFNGKGAYIGIELVAGQTFNEGDIINIHTTQASTQGSIALYNDHGNAVSSFHDYGVMGGTGDNKFALPASAEDKSIIYVCRTEANTWNGYVDYIEVTRAMNPLLTAITIDGRAGEIDPLDDKHFNVQIPYEAVLANLTIVPTIAWNAPAAENSIVVNDGGAWVEGDNTYKLTDKDGDYTVYTLTLTRDVLKHDVKFYDGETLLETLEVEDGTNIAAGDVPADPTKEDYIFQGWAETAGGDVVDVTSFTISAAKNFYAKWVADGAIKLINKSTGAINTTNFITGVTATEANSEKAAVWGGTQGTGISGVNQLGKIVQYNATTNQTKIKIKVYNTNGSNKYVYIHKVVEGKTTEETVETLTATSNTVVESEYYEFNDTKNRSFYLTTNSTDVKILQVKVIDDGATPMKQAGEAGYSLNLNKGRVVYYGNSDVTFEGLALNSASNYSVISSSEFQTTKNISFSISSPVLLKVTTNTAKYYVSQNPDEDGTTATAVTAAGTAEFELTETTNPWYLVPSTTSNVKYTNIAFELPKAATPVIETQPATNHTFDPGDMTATVVATVTEGTLHYQWYKKATVGDDEEVGTDAATLTTTTEGTYYVVVTNVLAGHQNTSVTSDEAELGYRVTNDATLMALSYGGTAITLEDGVYNYNVELAKGTTDVPALAATATMDGYATVTISNAAEFVSYAASSTVTVKSEDATVTNVYTVNFTVKHDLPQVDVTATTTWNWANAATTMQKIVPAEKDVEQLMANIDDEGKQLKNDAEFNSQALIFSGQEALEKSGSGANTRWFAKGGHIKFNVTVPGTVEVEFSDNGNNNRRVKINDAVSTVASASNTDVKTYKAYVQPGEVTLMGVKNDGTGIDQYIRISKIIFTANPTPDYTRNVSSNYGTLCVEHNVLVGGALGATFYQIASRNEDYDYKIDFEEVLPNEELKAGEPYLFKSNTGRIDLFYGETEAENPIPVRGMIGNYAPSQLAITEENKNTIYYFAQNKLYLCDNLVGGSLTLNDHRAYIDLTQVPTYAEYEASKQQQQNPAPRRRVSLEMNGEKIATGCENLNVTDKPVKMIINGQLFILRGEKMYDAKGQLVK